MASKVTVGLLTLLVTILPALAQNSPSYQLGGHNLNSAGTSAGSALLASPNFRITLGAIGDPPCPGGDDQEQQLSSGSRLCFRLCTPPAKSRGSCS